MPFLIVLIKLAASVFTWSFAEYISYALPTSERDIISIRLYNPISFSGNRINRYVVDVSFFGQIFLRVPQSLFISGILIYCPPHSAQIFLQNRFPSLDLNF